VIQSSAQVEIPVFTIVVSEKGGAERRETFDRPEINVGRVQSNDLMLPKGNVSKRHARLLFREGRFIVTDLNSTNGTYVNRRRISQATIVKQGDKIYIGDFVLRIELAGSDAEMPPPSPGEPSSTGTGQAVRAAAAAVDGASLPLYTGGRDDGSSGTSKVALANVIAPSRPTHVNVEAPRSRGEAGGSAGRQRSGSLPDLGSIVHHNALLALMDRVQAGLDQDSLDHEPVASLAPRVHDLVWSQLRALESEGQLSPELSLDQLALDAEAELLDAGPLRPLLEDEEIAEIAVLGHSQVLVSRGGTTARIESGFSSDAALRRAVMRLCRRAGAPLGDGETVVERRLPGGSMMWAVFEPATVTGSVLLVRKVRRVAATLEALVEHGAVSPAIGTFLEQCAVAGVNLLVVGPRDPGTAAVVSALGAAGGAEHLVALEGVDDLVAGSTNVTRLCATRSREDAVRLLALASHLPGARVVAELATPEVAGAVLEMMGTGTQGVVAVVRAGSLRRGLGRLVADLMVARPGLTTAAAREWVAAAFGVALEIGRLRDGACRVLRVSELDGTGLDDIRVDDVFAFAVERSTAGGTIEGNFLASGSIPKVVDEITSRGIQVDSSLFARL
jgi:pilus assembly protein CpaF